MTSAVANLLTDRARCMIARLGEIVPAVLHAQSGDVQVDGVFQDPSALVNTGYRIEVDGNQPVFYGVTADLSDAQKGDLLDVSGKSFEVVGFPEQTHDKYSVLTMLTLGKMP